MRRERRSRGKKEMTFVFVLRSFPFSRGAGDEEEERRSFFFFLPDVLACSLAREVACSAPPTTAPPHLHSIYFISGVVFVVFVMALWSSPPLCVSK